VLRYDDGHLNKFLLPELPGKTTWLMVTVTLDKITKTEKDHCEHRSHRENIYKLQHFASVLSVYSVKKNIIYNVVHSILYTIAYPPGHKPPGSAAMLLIVSKKS
jgi:hypothetical protein